MQHPMLNLKTFAMIQLMILSPINLWLLRRRPATFVDLIFILVIVVRLEMQFAIGA